MTVKLGYSYWQPYTCTHPILCECIHVREEGLPVLRPHPLGCLHSNPRQALLHKDGFMLRRENTLTQTYRERKRGKRERTWFQQRQCLLCSFVLDGTSFKQNNYRASQLSICIVCCVQAWLKQSDEINNYGFYNFCSKNLHMAEVSQTNCYTTIIYDYGYLGLEWIV